MGVIRNIRNSSNPYEPSIEEVFEEIFDENLNSYQQEQTHRPRKIKRRSVKLHAVGGVNASGSKSGKKKKRIDNSNFLLSLADPEEVKELSIHDFIPQTISVFCQLLKESENMETWNEFINCSDSNEWLHNVSTDQNHTSKLEHGETSCQTGTDEDDHIKHTAFTAAECYQRINNSLRFMLRKKHVPLGTLTYLENDIVSFFINRPQSIYQMQYPNSFERLLVHALSQYMDLSSLSYNKNGARWTKVQNIHSDFQPPTVPLSNFLLGKVHGNRNKY